MEVYSPRQGLVPDVNQVAGGRHSDMPSMSIGAEYSRETRVGIQCATSSHCSKIRRCLCTSGTWPISNTQDGASDLLGRPICIF